MQVRDSEHAADAPDLTLLDAHGNERRLSDFWQQGTTAFTFIRYLNCLFCREQVKELRDHAGDIARAGLQIVVIAPDHPEAAARFATQLRLPFPILCDPTREAYRAYGLTEGSFGQLVNPRVIVRGIGAVARGTLQGKPDRQNARQLPGTVIIDHEGRIRFQHRARDASDHLAVRRLLHAAEAMRQTDAAFTTRSA
jgi:peroxiredoxin